jgi:hypothetical protein
MTVVIIITIVICNLFIFAENKKYIDWITIGLIHEAIKGIPELNGISVWNYELSLSK